MSENSIYTYCFYRALRKEAQLLRTLGLHKRAYKVLDKATKNLDDSCSSNEKLFVYLQLFDLSEEFEPLKTDWYYNRLCKEADRLNS